MRSLRFKCSKEHASIRFTTRLRGVGICLLGCVNYRRASNEQSRRVFSPPFTFANHLQLKLDVRRSLTMPESIYTRTKRFPNDALATERIHPRIHTAAPFPEGTTTGIVVPRPHNPTTPYSPHSMTLLESLTLLFQNYQPTAHVRALHALLCRVHH